MFTSNVTLDPDDTEYDVRGTQMTGGPEKKKIFSEACLIRHALGETFWVGINRMSDYTVPKTQKNGQINVGQYSDMDYIGVGLDRFYCITNAYGGVCFTCSYMQFR